MANRKLTVDIDFQSNLNDMAKQAKTLANFLSNSAIPKEATKAVRAELNEYQRLLQKSANFQANTGNINNFIAINKQLEAAAKATQESFEGLGDAIKEAFADSSEIVNSRKKIEDLKQQIQEADTAAQNYFGTTSKAPQGWRKYFVDKKKGEIEGSDLSGAALISANNKWAENVAILKKAVDAREDLAKEDKKLNNLLEIQEKNQNAANAALEKAKGMYPEVQKALGATEEETRKLLQQQAQLNAQNAVDSLTNTIKRWTALGMAVQFVRDQFEKMKQTYAILDKSLTQIAVVSGRTREQMWNMIGDFNTMAQRLGTTTAQVVEASKIYFQQGRSQSEVMELVEQTTVLATISEIDFTDATNYLTAAVNGFKLAADESVNVTDTWANLASNAAVSTEELAVAISKVASLAQTAGASMESTSAFLAKMIETTREAPDFSGIGIELREVA